MNLLTCLNNLTSPPADTHGHTHKIEDKLLSFAVLQGASSKGSKAEKACLSLSVSCLYLSPCHALEIKTRGQAQTAWERLTTRGSEQRYIKGHPICTAAYTHPHIHKHKLTYLGLLSLKFITNGRTITLFWQHVFESTTRRGEFSSQTVQLGQQVQYLKQFLHYHSFSPYFLFASTSQLPACENVLSTDATKNMLCTANSLHKSFSVTADLSWCNKTARIISRWISGHLLPHPLISYCSLMRRKHPSTVI